MCGRFTLAKNSQQLAEAFAQFELPAGITPRYNIAPTQPVAVVANNGNHQVEFFQWGLVPFWAKDPSIGNRMINARAETLAEKPSFKAAYKRRRCLILADGFYEWQKSANSKTPFYIQLTSGEPFAFAGLWESWQNGDGSTLLSCVIITTDSNERLAPIHHRMPVILSRRQYGQWLDPTNPPPDLLTPYPASRLTAYAVSTVVNNPRNDTPECIEPV